MDYAVYAGCTLAAVAFCIAYFGLPTSLNRVRAGDVVSFEYLQPHHDYKSRRFEKVVDKYAMSADGIAALNAASTYRRNDPLFKRDGNLVVTENTHGDVHQYYTNRGIKCRKHIGLKPIVSLLQRS